MSVTKIIIVGALACLVNCVAASTASAKCEPSRGNDATEEFCFGPAGEAMKATTNLANVVGVSLNPTFTGAGPAIECAEAELEEGRLETTPKIRMRAIEFKHCEVAGGQCAISGKEVKTKPLVTEAGSLKESGEQAVEARVVPETGGIWALVTVTGEECAEAGKIAIDGGAKITLPHGQTQSVQQGVSINTAAGELRVGATEMKLCATLGLEPEAKEKWSFD